MMRVLSKIIILMIKQIKIVITIASHVSNLEKKWWKKRMSFNLKLMIFNFKFLTKLVEAKMIIILIT